MTHTKNPYAAITILPPKMAFPFPFPTMELPTTYAGTVSEHGTYKEGGIWPLEALRAMPLAMDEELELEESCENQIIVLDWTCEPKSGYTTHIAMIFDGSDYVDDDAPLDYMGVAFLRFDVRETDKGKVGFYSFHAPSMKDQPQLIECYEHSPHDTNLENIAAYVQGILNVEDAWKPLHSYIDD